MNSCVRSDTSSRAVEDAGDVTLASTPGRRGAAQAAAIMLGLVALVVVLYAPALEHPFSSFDDRTYLVENRALDAGLSREGLAWAFTTTVDGNRIPLTWISFLVDVELHGLSPRGTHATNVALHALASALLFLALWRMTGRPVPSAFVGAIFAAHPLHVESVAWAIERKDVLSGALFAATLLAWAGYAARPGVVRWLGVALLFALGLAAKPMLVTLPCVLLLLDAWPLGRLGSAAAVHRAVVEKLPLFALSGAASLVTVRAQAGAGALDAVEIALPWRLANALASHGAYLKKTFVPLDLAVIYPHRGDEVAMPAVAAGAAVVALVSLAAAFQWRRRPWIGVGWLWYLGMLVPVIGLLQVGSQAFADRYLYLPLAGVLITVAWTGAQWARRNAAARVAVCVLAAIAVLACAGLTRRQLAHWESDVGLYTRALAVTERNARAHNGLGLARMAEGRDAEARAEFEAALAIDPQLAEARVNLGVALLRLGEAEAAIPELRHGLAFAPESRALVHARLGAALLAAARPDDALDQARAGLALEPEAGALHALLGMAHVRLGRDALGLLALERAASLGVDDAAVYATLGDVLARRGRTAEAAERYRAALVHAPDDPSAANNLAWILATDPELRDPSEAVRLAERAAEAAPADASVLDTLAMAYHAAGRREVAQATAARAAAMARAAGDDALAASIEVRASGW